MLLPCRFSRNLFKQEAVRHFARRSRHLPNNLIFSDGCFSRSGCYDNVQQKA